jgi:serine/threonine protein kinase
VHFCTGGEQEPHGRFYAAIVLSAFAHIHSKKIAYRDLKPENLVFDHAGYVKLVDFGLAKSLQSGKAWTLCGTPDYLAPEIILNEGHDLAVDYWAFGVLIYEMMAGATPFFAQHPMEVYEKILSGSYLVPPTFSKHLTDLIKKLLRAHPSKRLGNTKGGTSAVMKHKWFNGFDWDGLITRSVRAPYVPDISGPDDTSHFESFDEDEQPPVRTIVKLDKVAVSTFLTNTLLLSLRSWSALTGILIS